MKAIGKKINKIGLKGTRHVLPLRLPFQLTSEAKEVEEVCSENKNSINLSSGETK